MQKFLVKSDIYFGADAVDWIDSLRKKKAFIVTDEMMVKIKAVDQITDKLEKSGIKYDIFSQVKPDPSYETVALGVKALKEFSPDLVVAIGGGSSIDTAKSILYSLWQISEKAGEKFEKPLFVAVPTTSGTGSEVTSFAIVTIGSSKLALVDDWLIPDVALVDSQFVSSVPPAVTADTGLDVLCHALEAYVSTDASDFTDALSEKAVKLVFDYLPEAYHDGTNKTAREKMHNASCMAGIGFSNASLGLIHSMAHALGGAFHIPHGRANAILMPYVISYNAGNSSVAKKRYSDMAETLGLRAESPEQGCDLLIKGINALKAIMGVPMNISQAGVSREELEARLDEMAENAINDRCTPTNPCQPVMEDIKCLYRRAFE